MKQFILVFDIYSTDLEFEQGKIFTGQIFKNMAEFHKKLTEFQREHNIDDSEIFCEIFTLENFCIAFNDERISDQHAAFPINILEHK